MEGSKNIQTIDIISHTYKSKKKNLYEEEVLLKKKQYLKNKKKQNYSYSLVDPASSHTLMLKIKPCMYEYILTFLNCK